jgi:lactoylglutathione lyase
VKGIVRTLFPMLSVEHLDRALEFYRDLLGGSETYRFPETGPPVFVVVQLGDSEVGLGQLGASPPLHRQVQRPASGHRIELCLYVEDVDATTDRLRKASTPVLLEPQDQPWGERVAYVADPDGNLLMLTRAPPEPAAERASEPSDPFPSR